MRLRRYLSFSLQAEEWRRSIRVAEQLVQL